jgi:diamine N-acetyltransferase
VLKGSHIYLRALEPEDTEILFRWENNTAFWKYGDTIIPFSKKSIKDYIDRNRHDLYLDKQIRFIICENNTNKSIGTIDLFDLDAFHNRCAIGILIADEQDRGKGYAKESIKVIIEFCFHFLRLHQIYCDISVDNEHSIQLFKSLGFKIAGTKKQWRFIDGKFVDEHLLQLIND